jgi:TM2 domain-containing membrane protein YozV
MANPYLNPVHPPKSTLLTYVLWFFLGLLGIHQFYMGKIGRGILYLLTAGVFGIFWIIDLFTIPGQVRAVNAQRAVGIR